MCLPISVDSELALPSFDEFLELFTLGDFAGGDTGPWRLFSGEELFGECGPVSWIHETLCLEKIWSVTPGRRRFIKWSRRTMLKLHLGRRKLLEIWIVASAGSNLIMQVIQRDSNFLYVPFVAFKEPLWAW